MARSKRSSGKSSVSKPVRTYQHGYNDGFKDGEVITQKAFGGCTKCYGKGYATTLEFASASTDFPDHVRMKRKVWQLPMMRFCSCARGKQLKKLVQSK